MITKIKAPKSEIMNVAKVAVENKREVRIWEKENTATGRIISVTKSGHILIVR